MLEALTALDAKLGNKLTVIMGAYEHLLKCRDKIGEGTKIYMMHDYTKFAAERAAALGAITVRDDLCIVDKPYLVFAPYQRKVLNIGVDKPIDITAAANALQSNMPKFYNGVVGSLDLQAILRDFAQVDNIAYRGQTAVELNGAIMPTIAPAIFARYSDRNFPSRGVTTLLSPYIKFGVISLRQAYYLSNNVDFRREIIFRQYFYQMYEAYSDRVEAEFGANIQNKYKNIPDDAFIAWCQGRTGVAMVDAGMRELNATGYMHNRCRMICASYLVHTMGYHWKLGEKYYANQLRDYDHVINKMNWGWVAGLRIFNRRPPLAFNPALQAKRYDKDAEYQNKWLK